MRLLRLISSVDTGFRILKFEHTGDPIQLPEKNPPAFEDLKVAAAAHGSGPSDRP